MPVSLGTLTIAAMYLGTTAISSGYLGTTQVFGGSAFSPSSLFAASEPGVWYDPSDLTTLFQDTAGTTPVTTPAQTVALMLDKSKGLVLGTELVVNGDFATDTDWTKGTDWTISGGVLARAAGAANSGTTQAFTLSIGKTYSVSVDVTKTSGSSVTLRLGATSAGSNVFVITANGTSSLSAKHTVSALTSGGTLQLFASADFVGTIDNISVKELPGNHATQATAASRPTYGIVPLGGRRNLEVQTQNFAATYWVKGGASLTATNVIAPDGTATACTLTGAGTGNVSVSAPGAVAIGLFSQSWYVKASTETKCEIWNAGGASLARFDLTAVTATTTGGGGSFINSVGNGWFRIGTYAAAYSGYTRLLLGHGAPTLTTSMHIWGVQVEAGSTATPYQRVSTAFDVTEAGVQSLSYLSFDGVDDFMLTGTITPGVDKAQVFAGVRKLSDAAAGVIVELGAAQSVNGSLSVVAREYAANDYGLDLRGTSGYSWQNYITFPSPITNVLSGLFDQAATTLAGELSLRVNGVVATTGSSFGGPNGNTNFAVAPLYIGRRGGVSAPLSGQIFSLITRFGANLDTTAITNTETWVNGKTGAYT